VFGSNTPFSGSGSLVDITFPTVTGGPGTFTPVNFVGYPQVPAGFWYNEGAPSSCLANGSVQILGSVGGNIVYDNDKFGAPFTRPVPGVTLNVAGGPPVVAPGLSDADGNYSLSGFGVSTYVVTPFRAGASAPTTNGAAISAYDAGYTARRIVGLVTFSAKQDFVANVTGTGQVSSFDSTAMARWAVGLQPVLTFQAGDWRFAASSTTYFTMGTYNTPYLGYLMGDPSGNWCDPTANGMAPFCTAAGVVTTSPRAGGPSRATSVVAPKMSAPAGGDVVVPVSVQGVADKDIISYQFDLHYDASVLRPAANAVTLGEAAATDMQVVVNPTTPGVLRVAVFGPYALSQAGTLFNLHFTAVGSALSSSPLTFTNFMFNEGGIRQNVVDGMVSLTPAVANNAAE